MTRTHPAGVRNSSQTTLWLCFRGGKPASFQSPGPGRSGTPVVGGEAELEPGCAGLGAAHRAWSLSERAGSGKIGSPRRLSGSGPAGPAGPVPTADLPVPDALLRAPANLCRRPAFLPSDLEQSRRAGSGGRLGRKQAAATAATQAAPHRAGPDRAGPDRAMPVRKKGKPLSLGAVCLLAANS